MNLLDATFRPLTSWPREQTKVRRKSQFKAGFNDTLLLLKREIRQLEGRDVVIELAMDEDQLRVTDSYPRSDARARGPHVKLSFYSRRYRFPMCFMTDEFKSWQENLRAIALAMERLRLVDDYGVTKSGEQYKGWKALPETAGTSPEYSFPNADRRSSKQCRRKCAASTMHSTM